MERSIKKGGGLGVGMEDVVRGDVFFVRFLGGTRLWRDGQ